MSRLGGRRKAWLTSGSGHIAWTSYGWRTTEPGSPLDACPDNAGAYHTNDYSMTTVFSEELSGCALAIADVDDIDATNKDNLVVFSVQKDVRPLSKFLHSSFG